MITKQEIERICGDVKTVNSPHTLAAQLIAKEECNGWSNQETWTANLWLANEQVTSEHARDLCDPAHGRTKYENGRLLQEYVQGLAGRLYGEASMRADMFGCAMARVEWHEVAEHFEER